MIGSGFAAQQLVKSLRKLDAEQPIRLITADSGDEYNKPDLSHVVSRGCAAAAMTRQSGSDFAEQQRIALLPHCPVLGIDPARRLVLTEQGSFPMAGWCWPPVPARYAPSCRAASIWSPSTASRSMPPPRGNPAGPPHPGAGAGLIGCELAMDMASDGREVTLLDLADSPLSALLPATLTQPLQQALRSRGSACSAGQVSPG